MLKARVMPGLPGCQQQTYVPVDAFWAGMSANAASIDRLAEAWQPFRQPNSCRMAETAFTSHRDWRIGHHLGNVCAVGKRCKKDGVMTITRRCLLGPAVAATLMPRSRARAQASRSG